MESIIFILVRSSFLSVKFFLKIWANNFSLLIFESFKPSLPLFFWGKTVIRLVFLCQHNLNSCQKLAIFKFLFLFHFVIIFYSLSSHSLRARLLFLIVLHNGVRKYPCEKHTWFIIYKGLAFNHLSFQDICLTRSSHLEPLTRKLW